MKKIFMAIVAMTMLIATSCKKENVNAPENLVPDEGEFLVTIANAPRQNAPAAPSDGMTVKTIIDGSDILWQAKDEISINGVIYETEMNGTSVIFKSKGGAAAPGGDGNYKAYYPVEIAGGSLPDDVTYDDNNLKNLPMYAVSESNTFTFNNICAALKITVPDLGEENTCNKIVISANENLAGLFSIGTDEETGAPMAVLSGDAGDMSKEITITPITGSTFATGDLVYVAIPAGTYTNFAIGFLNGETTVMCKMLTKRTLKVNNLYNLNISNDIPTDDIFHFTALQANAQIAAPTTKNLEYCIYHSSKDAYVSWTGCNGPVTLSAAGDKIYFRVKTGELNITIQSTIKINNGNVSVGGNIMYLLDHDGSKTAPMDDFCFQNLFSGVTKLIDAEDLILPAEKMEPYCYKGMFKGCTNLTKAPALPATTLAQDCYTSMFQGCTSLTTAPALNATSLAEKCCYYMFKDCSTLVTVPALNASSLAQDCYTSMFENCTSLTTAPALNATSLAENCYKYMFKGCTSLTTAPALNATSLAKGCYYYMFENCTSLTTAPALNATSLEESCYGYMFKGCTSLTTAPDLNATSLAKNCYYSMFENCTTLTTAPELPATTLTNGCYRSMFKGCSNLKSVTMLATDASASQCLTQWLNGASTSGAILTVNNVITTSHAAWSTINNSNNTPSNWTIKTESGTTLR